MHFEIDLEVNNYMLIYTAEPQTPNDQLYIFHTYWLDIDKS